MSKKFFRFLRGKLNGFYITSLNNTLNKFVEDVETFFVNFHKMQFDTLSMPEDTIYNIGTFAGVHLIRLSVGEAYGAMRMTEGYIDNGNERSERGLLQRSNEQFDFVHTEQDNYPDDINTLATSDKRSSLVGNETVQGYIASSETDVIDDEGNVKSSAILDTPPSNEAYSEFYGNQFMFLSEQTNRTNNISASLFLELYKVMQYIRYNGVNIKSFAQVISILCPNGLVTVLAINKANNAPYFNVSCQYDISVELDFIQQRLSTFEYIMRLKFPQFLIVPVE